MKIPTKQQYETAKRWIKKLQVAEEEDACIAVINSIKSWKKDDDIVPEKLLEIIDNYISREAVHSGRFYIKGWSDNRDISEFINILRKNEFVVKTIADKTWLDITSYRSLDELWKLILKLNLRIEARGYLTLQEANTITIMVDCKYKSNKDGK